MNDKYVSKYVGLGYRTPSPKELSIRQTAQDLKIPTDDAIEQAAREMAALIDGSCWLVPVPASDAIITANLALANAIVALVEGARVKCAVGRARPVESSCERRLRGLHGLSIEEHHIIRTAGPMHPLPVYYVDNVVTTGITIAACRRALGWGEGLTYADASSRRIPPPPFADRFLSAGTACPTSAKSARWRWPKSLSGGCLTVSFSLHESTVGLYCRQSKSPLSSFPTIGILATTSLWW